MFWYAMLKCNCYSILINIFYVLQSPFPLTTDNIIEFPSHSIMTRLQLRQVESRRQKLANRLDQVEQTATLSSQEPVRPSIDHPVTTCQQVIVSLLMRLHTLTPCPSISPHCLRCLLTVWSCLVSL